MSRLAATILVLATLGCKPPEYPLCQTNDHCRSTEQCRDGRCVQCTADDDCIAGSSCIDGVCEASLDGCSKNADCNQGQVCLFDLCSSCFEDDQCDEGLRCADGACVGCAEDSDCDEPLVCLDGSCADAPPPEDEPEMVIGPEGCVIEPVYFEFDSAALSEEAKKILDTIAKCLPEDETTVCVGFTDPMGDHLYNLDLGLRRAEAVVAYLKKKGVSEDHIVATTVGAKGAGSDEEKARRVEFK